MKTPTRWQKPTRRLHTTDGKIGVMGDVLLKHHTLMGVLRRNNLCGIVMPDKNTVLALRFLRIMGRRHICPGSLV
jgi:hypothetical protein